jgi:hypothetical protein
LPSSIESTVEGDERAAAISLGELLPLIEEHAVEQPGSAERENGLIKTRLTLRCLLRITMFALGGLTLAARDECVIMPFSGRTFLLHNPFLSGDANVYQDRLAQRVAV